VPLVASDAGTSDRLAAACILPAVVLTILLAVSIGLAVRGLTPHVPLSPPAAAPRRGVPQLLFSCSPILGKAVRVTGRAGADQVERLLTLPGL